MWKFAIHLKPFRIKRHFSLLIGPGLFRVPRIEEHLICYKLFINEFIDTELILLRIIFI